MSMGHRLGVSLAVVVMLLIGCGRSAGPQDIALAYGRALYANDGDAIWKLASERDRHAKDRATFRQQQQIVDGFARELLGQLGEYVTATPVATAVNGDRARVTLKLRLPDANAKAISDLAHGWDEKALNELPEDARHRIRTSLQQLHRDGAMPVVEGEESFVCLSASRWSRPLPPSRAVSGSASSSRSPIRATARSRPALLHCPLLIPVRLAPGATRDFVSEYLLLADSPEALKVLEVTYTFPAAP